MCYWDTIHAALHTYFSTGHQNTPPNQRSSNGGEASYSQLKKELEKKLRQLGSEKYQTVAMVH